jgi:hypothetical protein
MRIAALLFALAPCFGATLYGPTPYLTAADSPFALMPFSWFHIETLEDAAFNVPGATSSTDIIAVPNNPNVDSVDGDDGTINGFGQGHSFYAPNGPITFTFSAAVLGKLPTSVGIVWTDTSAVFPGNIITFEAFGEGGRSLGVLTGSHFDPVFNGTTAEDRFYGVSDHQGISSIRIGLASGNIEVDHFQFGSSAPAAIPEPRSILSVITGLAIVVAGRRRCSFR